MAIGVFGQVPELPGGAPVLSGPLYWMYEWGQAGLTPSRAMADAARLYFKNPFNPFAQTTFGKSIAAGAFGDVSACYSSTGVPLKTTISASGSTITMEATAFSTAVTDADFALPAAVR